MLEAKRKGARSFSYEAEKDFYSQRVPQEALPYLHLERYLRCWFDPEAVFHGKRVLDIGAGECTYTRLIADRFGPRVIVACELFRERMLPAFQENRNPHLKSVAGNCFRLPFRSCSFDVAFASGVLSQLPGLKDAVSEIARVLKPGGLFVGWDPNPFNPVILYRYLANPHSGNQYMFWPHKVRPVFEASGFTATTRFFYAKLPWARSRFLGTCIGILAHLADGSRDE
jgi:SAM-dependent methyltransferase